MQPDAIYQTLFWIGTIGVAIMGAMGAASHGHHADGGHAHNGGGHAGHDGGAGYHPLTLGRAAPRGGHARGGGAHVRGGAKAHARGAGGRAGGGANALALLLGVLSPMTLFSVSLGAGATGMLLGSRYPARLTALLAVIAGLAFFALVVSPLTRFAQRFVSDPAKTLAGTVAGEAVAQNRFDASGRGIVNVSLDGQIVRLLAYLERGDHASGVSVAPGDTLVITQIDEAKNTCRVTKL